MKEQLSLLSTSTENIKRISKNEKKEDIKENPQNYEKRCKVCGTVKTLTEFPYARRRVDRRETICKSCCTEQRIRSKHYYPILTKKHGAVCAICGVTEEQNGKRLAVDHCHTTGVIRGLLCSACNTSLGKFKDSVELLQRAIQYLKDNNGNQPNAIIVKKTS